jgi:hypothetical protein
VSIVIFNLIFFLSQCAGVLVGVGVFVGAGVGGGPYKGAGPYNTRKQPANETPNNAETTQIKKRFTFLVMIATLTLSFQLSLLYSISLIRINPGSINTFVSFK